MRWERERDLLFIQIIFLHTKPPLFLSLSLLKRLVGPDDAAGCALVFGAAAVPEPHQPCETQALLRPGRPIASAKEADGLTDLAACKECGMVTAGGGRVGGRVELLFAVAAGAQAGRWSLCMSGLRRKAPRPCDRRRRAARRETTH